MAEQNLKQSEQVERVRQAVIAAGGSVTVGDIVSRTGLGQYEAKAALDALIITHEGTMRVSQNGDLMYAFAAGVGLRDSRSWWDRNKKAIYRGFKKLFKIVIMLVLVIYFILYLVIIIALLTSNRNSNSRNSDLNLGGVWYFFWGYNSGSRGSYGRIETDKPKKTPLYTRVYNFVFGPEEEEVDPLEAGKKCAQLIRAKNGVITAEDWMSVSGQSLEKCESDLARFTAEFEGTAEITDNGTLVYVFEDMMKSARKSGKKESMPARAWSKLKGPRPMSGNINGGNGAVIGLNLFNLIMAAFFTFGGLSALADPNAAEAMIDAQTAASLQPMTFWLGIFPFIFSMLIFVIPLIRLPFNIKENNRRREEAVRVSALSAVLREDSGDRIQVSDADFQTAANHCLGHSNLEHVKPDELKAAVATICDELEGEPGGSTNSVYTFDNMSVRLADAQKERAKRRLDQQDLGRVVYSSDSREQERLDEANAQAELDDFEERLKNGGVCYDTNYSSSSSGASSNASRMSR